MVVNLLVNETWKFLLRVPASRSFVAEAHEISVVGVLQKAKCKGNAEE